MQIYNIFAIVDLYTYFMHAKLRNPFMEILLSVFFVVFLFFSFLQFLFKFFPLLASINNKRRTQHTTYKNNNNIYIKISIDFYCCLFD